MMQPESDVLKELLLWSRANGFRAHRISVGTVEIECVDDSTTKVVRDRAPKEVDDPHEYYAGVLGVSLPKQESDGEE